MQMHDTLRHLHGGPVVAVLADAFGVTPNEADVALPAVQREMAWHLEKNTLSRGGLADMVEALDSARHAEHLHDADVLRGARVRAAGNAILAHALGSEDRRRTLGSRGAREAGLSERAVASMLPALAVIAMARVASRARNRLVEVLAVMPSLGRWSRGNAYADLADILRRGCGGGPHAPAKLRRVVRRAVAHGAGFPPRSALRWYLQFMLGRPAARALRPIAARARYNRLPA